MEFYGMVGMFINRFLKEKSDTDILSNNVI